MISFVLGNNNTNTFWTENSFSLLFELGQIIFNIYNTIRIIIAKQLKH